MFHKHNWELVETNRVEGINEYPEVRGGRASQMIREVAYITNGYYSYVFKCPCGAVKVTRS